MVRPQNENFLQDKTEAPAERAKKAKMGRGFVILLICFAAIMFSIYIGIAVFGLSYA
ncbi:hypothetical protein SAMN03159496_06177 [Rhizobium sp. NFR07]|nr:hypothetical protein SAMN03159496_06177 [Rhizobium sp. NFR07]